MSTEDKGAEFEGSSQKQVERLIEQRNKAIGLMFQVKDKLELDMLMEEIGQFHRLKQALNMLLFDYWPKLSMAKSFEIDEELAEKIEEGSEEPNVDNLNFEECKQLLYKINELMVELGHTKYETDKTGRTTV